MSRIVGIGELLVDAHYLQSGLTYEYSGSRGGGSVWNILANAKSEGAAAIGLALGTFDWRTQAALADLKELGVVMHYRQQESSLPTPTMHHMPVSPNASAEPHGFRTSSSCTVCTFRTRTIELTVASANALLGEISTSEPGIFVADRISTVRVHCARELRARGWFTVVDIGYPGYLRYMRSEQLVEKLEVFDLIVMQHSVATFLLKRLGIENEGDLSARLQNRIIVSDGENGLNLWEGSGSPHISVPAPKAEVVDTVGAGDMMLGTLIARLSNVSLAALRERVTIEPEVKAAVARVPEVLAVVGARAHLSAAREDFGPQSNATIEQLREDSTASGSCVVCGNRERPVSFPRRLSQSGRNLAALQRRIIAAASSAVAVESCRRILEDPQPTVVCASGGSFPAARLIADSLNATGSLAVAMRPLDALTMVPPATRVIGISYSGRSSDTLQAMAVLRHERGCEQFFITRADGPPGTAKLVDDMTVISYGRSDSGMPRSVERGFVAVAAAVAPAALWSAASTRTQDVVALVRDTQLPGLAQDIATRLAGLCALRIKSLAIISSGWSNAAQLDIESKVIEAGLGHTVLHETKDFSHGRFVSIVGERSITGGVLLLACGPTTTYETHLRTTLESTTEVEELRSPEPGILGGLELLYSSQQFSRIYGMAQGVDMSRPGSPPKEYLHLYRWNSGLGVEV